MSSVFTEKLRRTTSPNSERPTAFSFSPAGAYRPDIDGLRAVAVLAVVVFHAFPSVLSGGFVGVDVFFVISGYLITRILCTDLQRASTNGIDLSRFYERRVRRIFPALFAVLLVVALAACLTFSPVALNDLGKAIFATTLFSSNVLLNRNVGYFDAPAEDNPLLHCWSLAVEEQFYLFFPFVLWLVQRYASHRRRALLSALAAGSLIASAWYVRVDRNAAFYLPQFRAWELLMGSLLAIRAFPATSKRAVREALVAIGLALIGVATLLYDAATPFPGLHALAPCLGAAAILYAGESGDSLGSKLIASRPLVRIGLLSYSLYLWHWPLLVFARYYAIRPLTGAETCAVLVLAAAVSFLSWRFIETPARHAVGPRRTVLLSAGAAMAVVGGIGFTFAILDGLPQRLGNSRHLAVQSAALQPGVCDEPVLSTDHYIACAVGGSRLGKPSFAIWGDSHARVLGPAIARMAEATGRRGFLATSSGCPPIVAVRHHAEGVEAEDHCVATIGAISDIIASEPSLRDVILVGRWSYYVEGTPYRYERKPRLTLEDSAEGSSMTNAAVFERGLDRMLSHLQQSRVRTWILTQVPEVGIDVPSALIRMQLTPREISIAPTMEEYRERQRRTLAILERDAARYGARLIPVERALCDDVRCRVTRDGRSLYADDDHLSADGAAAIAPLLTAALQSPPELLLTNTSR